MSDALLDDIHAFLGDTEWEGAEITPLVGDASFRRYFRLKLGGKSAMLMHAPPPEEDPKPFLHVAHWLETSGLRAPHILLEDAARGWVLTEDFGDQRMQLEALAPDLLLVAPGIIQRLAAQCDRTLDRGYDGRRQLADFGIVAAFQRVRDQQRRRQGAAQIVIHLKMRQSMS